MLGLLVKFTSKLGTNHHGQEDIVLCLPDSEAIYPSLWSETREMIPKVGRRGQGMLKRDTRKKNKYPSLYHFSLVLIPLFSVIIQALY